MSKEVRNAIFLGISVLIILLVSYLTTAVFLTGEIGEVKKDKTTTTTSASVESYKNMIVAGQTFNRSEEEYMVVFFSNSKSSDELKTAVSDYNSTEKELKLYVVNLDEALNNYILSTTFNSNAQNASELKIMDQAIITIKDGQMESYLISEEDIIEILK